MVDDELDIEILMSDTDSEPMSSVLSESPRDRHLLSGRSRGHEGSYPYPRDYDDEDDTNNPHHLNGVVDRDRLPSYSNSNSSKDREPHVYERRHAATKNDTRVSVESDDDDSIMKDDDSSMKDSDSEGSMEDKEFI